MGLLTTVLVDGGGKVPRQVRFLGQVVRHPVKFLRSMSVRRWSERSIILLVMQSRDNSIALRRNTKLGRARHPARPRRAEPDLPAGRQRRRPRRRRDARRRAVGRVERDDPRRTDHRPHPGWLPHRRPGRPSGVIDAYHRVYGYEGLYGRRRLGGLRQPRGEPVAHHHRHDRAGDEPLAEQGRARPPAAGGRARTGGSPPSTRRRRRCPSTHRPRSGWADGRPGRHHGPSDRAGVGAAHADPRCADRRADGGHVAGRAWLVHDARSSTSSGASASWSWRSAAAVAGDGSARPALDPPVPGRRCGVCACSGYLAWRNLGPRRGPPLPGHAPEVGRPVLAESAW